MRRATVTLTELLEEQREDINDIEANIDDLVSGLEEEYGDYATFAEEAPDRAFASSERLFDELEERKTELEAKYEAAKGLVEDLKRDPEDVDEEDLAWGDDEFKVQALVTSDIAEIQDQVGQTIESERDLESVEGAAMVEMSDRMVIDAPDPAPDYVGDYPPPVTELLSKKGIRMSGLPATGESRGNSSLRQRMGT